MRGLPIYARIAWDTQRKLEFNVPAKRHVCKNCLGYASEMRISSASRELEMESSLKILSKTVFYAAMGGNQETPSHPTPFPEGPKGPRVAKIIILDNEV